MILTIDFNADDVLYRSKSRIALKLNYYHDITVEFKAEYLAACYLGVQKGSSLKEFEKKDAGPGKLVFVGSRGGLSLGT